MPIDPGLVAAGFLVGLLVGLTGMGGGTVMTPFLISVVGVSPVLAIGTDLVSPMDGQPVRMARSWQCCKKRLLVMSWHEWATLNEKASSVRG